MRSPVAFALAVTLGLAGSAAASTPAHADTPPGTIILVGGALADDNAAIYGEFVRLAGGAQARIGVLSASSAVPHSSANAVAKILKRMGVAEATWIPVTVKRDGSGEDPANAALAASMTGFFFAGGDQFRYVQSMIRPDGSDGAVLAAVRQRFAAGAPVAGTSAGMQIFAGPDMVTGGLSYFGVRDGAQAGYFTTDEVLGYWPAGGFAFLGGNSRGDLVDTHFDARGRHGRSIRLAADTGHDRVYGVGENTALVVPPTGPMRVIGTNGVSLLDLATAQVGQVGGRWAISGVRWSYLTDGDTYDPALRQVTKAAGSAALVPDNRSAGPPTADVFGSYALRDAAFDLADAARSTSTTGATAETDPRFVVELAKDAGFTAYTVDGATAASFTGLAFAIRVG